MTPQKLTPLFPSLPPILYMKYRVPISSYSKALRGLSVQSRVIRIFTYTTISPGPLLRQRPSRYAIRAGQNLPDKEFRYLRTVIVTAASSTGQASAPILQLAFSQKPVFLINSRLGLFTATDFRRLPFSRSYGVILQSSLTMVLPLVLQFSCRLPVSVCGTGTFRLFSSFSRQREFIPFATSFHSTSSPGL